MIFGTIQISMLKILDRIDIPESKTSGLDSLENCLDKKYFQEYSKTVSYRYNSRGFRDEEWPANLNDVIWCLGDSFTVGIGQPFEETWPQLLEKATNKRCINLGQDGCSNDTMAQRAIELVDLYKPKLLVIMWSFFTRRQVDGNNVQYSKLDFGNQADVKNFETNFLKVQKLPGKKIHMLVPNAFMGEQLKSTENPDVTKYALAKLLRKDIADQLIYCEQVDYSRDYHHFDVKTAENLVREILKK